MIKPEFIEHDNYKPIVYKTTYTDCKLLRFPIPGDKAPDTLWLGSPLMI